MRLTTVQRGKKADAALAGSLAKDAQAIIDRL